MEREIIILIVIAVIVAISFISNLVYGYNKENDFIYIHTKTGNKYRLFQECLMKFDGKWMNAVIYSKEESGELYVREYDDFVLNFKRLSEWKEN